VPAAIPVVGWKAVVAKGVGVRLEAATVTKEAAARLVEA
jgi:hypothetical protein